MKSFSFNGCKAGDVIINKDGERAKILDVFPNTFIRSVWGVSNIYGSIYTYEYAKEEGWTFEGVEEKWKPLIGEEYWYIGRILKPHATVWGDMSSDKELLSVNNCFKTEAECEAKCAEIRKILKG